MSSDWISRPLTRSRALAPILAVAGGLALATVVARERWLLLAPFAALFAIPLALRWPVATSLGVYAFLIPFDDILAMGPGGPTVNRLVGVVAAAILLAAGLVGRRFARPPKAAFWWIGFVVWGATTMLWAIDSDSALSRLPTAVSLLLLYLLVVSFRLDEGELSSVVWSAILGAVSAAAFTIHEYSQGLAYPGALKPEEQRASLIALGREADPNQLATYLLLPLSCAIGLFLASRSKLRNLFLLILTVPIAGGLFLTMSRGTLTALVVMLIVQLRRSRISWRVWGILAVLGGLTWAMPEHFFARFARAYQTGGAGRLNIWRGGLEALKHYAWIGAGWDGFPLAYNRYARYANQFHGSGSGAHNIYLGMSVEVGILGLALMLGAVALHLREARSCLTAASESAGALVISIEAACWGMLTSGLFLDIVWRKSFWLVWMLLAVAVRVRKAPSGEVPP